MIRHLCNLTLLFIIYIISSCGNICAQEYISRKISTLDGLSQNDVLSIIQDKNGFIWIATNDGLNRYDGYTFKNFGIDQGSLSSNLILAIDEDKFGNLWIGTADKGIFVYNIKTNVFERINFKAKGMSNNFSCRNLKIDNQNRIWFYNKDANTINLMDFDYQKSKIKRVISSSLLNNKLTDFVCMDKNIVIALTNGLFQCHEKSSNLILTQKSSLRVRNIALLSPSEIFATVGTNIYLINLQTQTEKSVFTGEYIRNMQYGNRKVYFTTNNGVFESTYNPSVQEFVACRKIYNYRNYISQSILLDKDGSVWVGCLKNAILYLTKSLKPIKSFPVIGNNHISIMCERNKNLFIATEGTGLFRCENDNLLHQIPKTEDKVIYSFTMSPYNQKLYYGVQSEGLFSASENGANPQLIFKSMSDVRALLSDENFIWIGTYDNSLFRYNIDTKQIIKIGCEKNLHLKIIRNLILDRKHNLWIATDKGLYVINAQQKNTKNPIISSIQNSIATDYIVPLFEDRQSNIWYGTLGHGLKKIENPLSKSNSKIITYTTKSGLTSNTIKGIIQDDKGLIWISSNKGINCLDPQSGKILSYGYSDGLQDNEFNELSAYKLANGNLLFGGVNGLNEFNPNNFIKDKSTSVPILTAFKIFNVNVREDSLYNAYFKESIPNMKEIKLPYNLNSFTFVFSGLNYINPQKIKYEYKLDGIDEKWMITTSERREATYTKLSPGTYIFRLRASNTDGLWNGKEYSVKVVIAPPFWLTWYAYLFYALLIGFVVYKIKNSYTERLKRKNAIYIANLEKKKSEELLEMKTNFFTNISHELRTPMTLILSPLQILKENKKFKEDKELNQLLQVINHNGNVLMRLVNQLLSFSKSEANKLKINFKYKNFASFSKNIFQQFAYLSQEKGIQMNYSVSSSNIFMYYDPYLMEQVIYNLISNAIKHTDKGGSVSFSITEEDKKIIVSVSDSGKGIEDEMKGHIFERFYSGSKSNGGTGIGLYLTKRVVEMHEGRIYFKTEKQKGTIFIVELPILTPKDGILDINQQKSESDNTMVEYVNDDEKVDNKEILSDAALVENTSNKDFNENDKSQTILFVDDNVEICSIVENLLKSRYKIVTANDGTTAWEKIPDMQPDLVISDIMMKEMNGLELCEKIKSDERTSHIPVILLTAKSSEEDFALGYHFQADAYCTKPFNHLVLKEMINSILNNRKRFKKTEDNHLEINPSEVTTTSTDEKFLQKLIKIVEENISNSDFQVYDLCNGAGVTSLILNKKLKTLLGITANVFIRNIRLKRAAALLKTKRYSVSEITYDVGFNDLKYFRECFKKEFGMLPQQYKDEFSEKEAEVNQ